MASEVTIDGEKYRKVAAPSEVRIVILQRGWVMVGRWSQDGETVTLDDARVIRRWGTTKGLGELRSGPKPQTTLDPAGRVQFHILTMVASLDAEAAGWSL